jgi:hypothetical protein
MKTDLSLDIAALTLEGASLKLNGRGGVPQGSSGQTRAGYSPLDRFADLAELPALPAAAPPGGYQRNAGGSGQRGATAGAEYPSSAPLADALLGPGAIAGRLDRGADGALSASISTSPEAGSH